MSMLTKSLSAAVMLSGLAAAGMAKPALATSDVFGTFANSGTVVSGTPFITLFVPKGKYAIFGKVGLDQDTGVGTSTVNCTLQAGVNSDLDIVRVTGTATFNYTVIPLEVTNEFLSTVTSSNKITISCTHSSPKLSFVQAKILAVRVDGLRCNKVNPGICP